MSLFILQNSLATDEQYWIERCKSSAMETGYRLREAHSVLGTHLARHISQQYVDDKHYFVVAILMRAGLPFGMGIADELERLGHDVAIYFIDEHTKNEWIVTIEHKILIIADAVVHSGQSIQEIMVQLPSHIQQNTIVATTVIPMNSLSNFTSWNIMTVRVSQNHYEGAKIRHIENGLGPDTGDRLFGTL